MANTWILVAHRGGARFFENKGPGKGVALVQEIDHPEGKLKNKEIDTDRAGRGSNGGVASHAYATEHLPTEHVAEQFAKQLAGVLEDGRTSQRFDRLVLVAEPRFLGNLRSAISNQTASMVTATVDKDLGTAAARELPRHLEHVIYL